jgi:hypothetical protein
LKSRAPLHERLLAKIAPVQFNQIEAVDARRRASPVEQCEETRLAVAACGNQLTVDNAGSCREPEYGCGETGSQQLIDIANEILTDESSLLYGAAGRPAKLRKHLSGIAANFRRRKTGCRFLNPSVAFGKRIYSLDTQTPTNGSQLPSK